MLMPSMAKSGQFQQVLPARGAQVGLSRLSGGMKKASLQELIQLMLSRIQQTQLGRVPAGKQPYTVYIANATMAATAIPLYLPSTPKHASPCGRTHTCLPTHMYTFALLNSSSPRTRLHICHDQLFLLSLCSGTRL
jgi:hypothetical protein